MTGWWSRIPVPEQHAVLRSPGSFATWPVSTALLHRAILEEERVLADRFGDASAAYQKSVARYLHCGYRGT